MFSSIMENVLLPEMCLRRWGFLEPLETVRDGQVTRKKSYGHSDGLRKVFLGIALGVASISYFPYKELVFFFVDKAFFSYFHSQN